MNKEGKKTLGSALPHIQQVYTIISDVLSDEQSKYDDMSAGLQQSRAGQSIEEAISKLEDVLYEVQSIEDSIKEIVK